MGALYLRCSKSSVLCPLPPDLPGAICAEIPTAAVCRFGVLDLRDGRFPCPVGLAANTKPFPGRSFNINMSPGRVRSVEFLLRVAHF